jgi:hypothetical protein
MTRKVCVATMTKVALAALLAGTAALARAQQPVTVELHHRSAESLVSVLRPLLAPAAVAGAGTRLQVRTAPADLARAVRLIEQADRPLQALVVSLSDDPSFAPDSATEGRPSSAPDSATEGRPSSAPGSATQGRASSAPDSATEGRASSAPGGASAKAGSVTLSTGRPLAADAHGNAQVLSTGRPLAADEHGNGQVVSTRPGPRPAELVEGEALLLSMPAPQSLWFGLRSAKAVPGGKAAGTPSVAPPGAKQGGTDVAGVVQFDTVSDFTARIWVAGETVAIDLQPRVAGRLSGAADTGADHATVYGRTGQWIALADSGGELAPAGVAQSAAPRAGLWIKVELAPSFAPDMPSVAPTGAKEGGATEGLPGDR